LTSPRPETPLHHDLTALARHAASAPMTLGELVRDLGASALPLLLLLTAIPNSLPLPGIPGVSAVFGLPAIFFGLQVAQGRRPWLPNWLARRSLPGETISRTVGVILPRLERAERWLRPWRPKAAQRLRPLAGIAAAWCGFLLALPIVLGNLPPGIALLALAIGLCTHNAGFLAAGLVGTALATAWVMLLLYAAVSGAAWAFGT
jgi:hypothetical protein